MKIIVVGVIKEGKSTIAQMIANALGSKFEGVVIEEELPNETPIPFPNLDKKINLLKNKFTKENPIVIHTFQAPRADIFKKNVSDKTVKKAIKKYE